MKAPHVSLENAEAVNEYFSQVEPNRALMRTLHFVMGRAIKATTIYEDGAKQQIDEGLSQGRQIFVAHNHQSFFDPFVLASMVQREKVLRPMRSRIAIPGKSPEFNNSYYGWVVRNSGAIPVFRRQEFGSGSEEARRRANDSQVAIMQAKMNQGFHGAIYPEGTRGRDDSGRDPTKLQPIHAGIGHIACGLDDPGNVRILCVGTIYGSDSKDHRHPTSFVARPFPVAEAVDEVVATTGQTLQKAVDTAVALSI